MRYFFSKYNGVVERMGTNLSFGNPTSKQFKNENNKINEWINTRMKMKVVES